jgi:hypothetical protein
LTQHWDLTLMSCEFNSEELNSQLLSQKFNFRFFAPRGHAERL